MVDAIDDAEQQQTIRRPKLIELLNDLMMDTNTFDRGGERLYCAREIGKRLGLSDGQALEIVLNLKAGDAELLYDSAWNQQSYSEHPLAFDGIDGILMISKAGVYELAFHSPIWEAWDFKYWIAYEVVPAIGRSGTDNMQESRSGRLPRTFVALEEKVV